MTDVPFIVALTLFFSAGLFIIIWLTLGAHKVQ